MQILKLCVLFFAIISANGQEYRDRLVLGNRAEFLNYFDTEIDWDMMEASPASGLPVEPGSEYFYLTRFGGQDEEDDEVVDDAQKFSFNFQIHKHICDVNVLKMSIRYCNLDTESVIGPVPILGRKEGVDFHTLRSHNIFAWDHDEFLLDHTAGTVR